MPASKSSKKRKRLVLDIPERLPVPIVDNHTHLHVHGPNRDSQPEHQRVSDEGELMPPVLMPATIDGMERAGIRAAISSGCEVPALQGTVDLAREYDEIWAALGIHPNESAMHAGVREVAPDGLEPRVEGHHEKYSLSEAIELVAELASAPEVVAIGETGLDYFRTGPEGVEAQKSAFREHIALAKELDKPMQIHDREAHADVVEILKKDGAPERTVFHCFSGDAELARVCRENGWYASFAGTVTYPANDYLRDAFAELPDELVLVETDAPYLTPLPFRGHPNAVWGAAYTVRFLAEERGVDLAEYCRIVDSTTREVYGI